MKYRHLFNILLLVAVAIFSSCAWDDHATVTINLQRNDLVYNKQEVKKEFSIIDKIISFIFFSTDANAITGWDGEHAALSSLTLTITGPDIDTITAQIPGGTTTYSLKIQPGINRKFTIINSTSAGNVPKNWGGSVVADLSPGTSVEITVNMIPMTVIYSVSPQTIGTLGISWRYQPESGSWPTSVTSINQIKIYRADSSAGPYTFLKTVSFTGTSGTTTDSGLQNRAYYYKVSILSTYGEGELSDYNSGVAPP